jgi:hypothetical protein
MFNIRAYIEHKCGLTKLKSPCKPELPKENKELIEAEERLLNAFQLIKNGKKIAQLKYSEFKKLMDKKHDYNGELSKTPDNFRDQT